MARGSEWFGRVGALVAVAFGALALILGASTGAMAEDAVPATTESLRIGVVDVPAIRRSAAVAQTINRQIALDVSDYQKDLQREEEALKRAQDNLNRNDGSRSPEQIEAERHRWQAQVAESQRRFLERRQAMERARARAWQKVNEAIEGLIAQVAKERDLVLIMHRDQLVFAAASLDITQEVVTRLDRLMPSLEVTVPGPPTIGEVPQALPGAVPPLTGD